MEKADDYERSLSGTNCGLQPRIVFLGTFKNLQAYVTLVDKKYNFAEPLEAVEQCFFLYQALNISYPSESIAVWNFMQIYIFKVTTKFDNSTSSIKSIWHNLNKR